jgi:hypothetical protein
MDLTPIIVTIPHRHGQAEAARRIRAGLQEVRSRYAAQLKVAEEKWEGDRLTFRVALLGQPATGTIEIGPQEARAEIKLSWYQAHLVGPAEALIRKEGERMLAD